ncbi:ArsR/SmtB family transcription factor [Streptomyces sp. P9-A4]|uniref:ArsR/SmtB family transcription factor n=1 Tax=Streptomyces sp. P9-A4 TaxID=3072285 RepID=UPI002FCB5A2F
MSAPLYQLKAEFFKTLGHPVRIRVLELLSEREHGVAEMLRDTGVEPAYLSQQLAVLRRANLVAARREGTAVYYVLTTPQVAELLRTARTILSGVLAGQAELLADLRAAPPARRARDAARVAPDGHRPVPDAPRVAREAAPEGERAVLP